ncbi:MAG: hypothetical protein CVU16_01565 [Betaproteobacteria bacterium HGW-Betaproteobacteria-10]|nr:MAG: hypothetical protein CVU16_01565 [Betaproteobacteria bacterium HGW-Betaproteobacteria-10]
MKRRSYRCKQKGAALWILLIALIMAGSFAFYRTSNVQFNRAQHESKLATNMALAKEALIARAVMDANRPGSLPCPDLITDSDAWSNHPGDGNSDKLIGAATGICPSYVGWLPWITLDLPELVDETGTRLWYVLSKKLTDDESASPINSDTEMELSVDGNNEIAALIIAPRGPLNGQGNRPSHTPSDYLDGENGNTDDQKYITGPQSDTFNDLVLTITRQELMAAVEKRVANEVKSCLEQHATSSANLEHRFPWPAPFSTNSFQGKAGSLFGRLPETQPGSHPKALLNQAQTALIGAETSLSHAADANEQLGIIQGLNETLTLGRNLFDAIYIASTQLWQATQTNIGNLAALNLELTKDLKPGTTGKINIIDSEKNRIIPLASAALTPLDILPAALAASGIDVFPDELSRRISSFSIARDIITLQPVIDLLSRSTSKHIDIQPKLSTAQLAATMALAATTPEAFALATDALLQSATALLTSITDSRINQVADEIKPYLSQLDTLINQVSIDTTALTKQLSDTQRQVNLIVTGTSTIVAARDNSSQRLGNALQEASTNTVTSQVKAFTLSAIESLETLINEMSRNDDNLTRSSLATATEAFKISQTDFANLTTTTTNNARVPYAQALQNAAVNLDFWTKIIAVKSIDLASQAKTLPVSAGTDLAKVTAQPNTAYQSDIDALAASQSAASALQTYIKTPTENKKTAAATARSNALNQLSTLIEQANKLSGVLSNTIASATQFPTVWLSSRCDFLQPAQKTWWRENQWKTLVFYQISDIVVSNPGTLMVNGASGYRLVVLAAGRTLGTQNRSIQNTENYLEANNSSPSRDGDGDATTLVKTFTVATPSSIFNDRLSY